MESKNFYMKKQIKMIQNMRKFHDNDNDNEDHLLNWSFRGGDLTHSQWTNEEEKRLLHLLVSDGRKPVREISNRIKRRLLMIKIPDNCEHLFHKNRWGMWSLFIYQKNLTSADEIIQLSEETLHFWRIGQLYGYYD